MTRRRLTDDEFRDLLLHPPYWLVYGLDWADPGADMAEAAYAIAPECTSQNGLPESVKDMLAVTFLYADEHPGQRVIWFTDITRWLATRTQSWFSLDIEWEDALVAIPRLPVLGLYLTINQRAYHHLVDTATERHTIHYLDGTSETLTADERQAVHDAFERKLVADWTPYVRTMLDRGRLTF